MKCKNLHLVFLAEDYLKDKTRDRKKDKDDYAITSEMLVEIVEESIRIFWQLIRSDKDCNTHKKMPEPHNPEDLKLLLDVRKILQKVGSLTISFIATFINHLHSSIDN